MMVWLLLLLLCLCRRACRVDACCGRRVSQVHVQAREQDDEKRRVDYYSGAPLYIYAQGSERAAANAHPRLLAPWSAGDSSQQKQRQKQQSGYPAVNTSSSPLCFNIHALSMSISRFMSSKPSADLHFPPPRRKRYQDYASLRPEQHASRAPATDSS